MLKRYHIIALDDLRRAAERGSAYESEGGSGTVVTFPRTRRVSRFRTCVAELDEC